MHWIIDTDAGIDDAIAIVLPFVPDRYPDFRLAAITTVTGNVCVDKVNTNVGALLDLLGADVPFYAGCDRPLIEPHAHAEEFHGEDGLGDGGLSKTKRVPEREHAAHAILHLSKRHAEDGFSIIALGPLTNLALAVNLDPTLPSRVQTLVTMAGAFQARGNQSHTAEYNVAIDPESARVVFDRFENIVVLPWEVSVDQGMSWERLNRLIALNTPRARFLKAMTPHMQKWRDTFFMPTLPMPDPLTVMIALDPNVATKHIDCRVRVDTARDVGRAMTALDVRTPHKNARMVTQIDEVKAWGMLDAAWSI